MLAEREAILVKIAVVELALDRFLEIEGLEVRIPNKPHENRGEGVSHLSPPGRQALAPSRW